jgi:hypothetical protein
MTTPSTKRFGTVATVAERLGCSVNTARAAMERSGRCLEGPSGERVMRRADIELLALAAELRTSAARLVAASNHDEAAVECVLAVARRIDYQRQLAAVEERADA